MRLSGVICLFLVVGLLTAQERPKYAPQGGPPPGERPADEEGEPYYLFHDKVQDFAPGGWMPNGDIKLAQSVSFREKPRRGKYCYRAVCNLEDDAWMGVAFLPGGKFEPIKKVNVCEKLRAKPGDRIVARFWARSPQRATVQFKIGGIDEDSLLFPAKTDPVTLPVEWTMYTLDLTKHDLSGVRAGFLWVVDRDNNEGKKVVEFFLDDIYYTRLKAR